jgi:hypothetical protein
VQLNYKFTFDDWKAALRLHSRQTIGRRIQSAIRDAVIPLLAAVGLIWIIVAKLSGDSDTVDNLLAPVIGLIFLAIFLALMMRYSIRKSFKGVFPPSENGPGYCLDINDERILSTRPGLGEATYYWKGICSIAQDDKITLLYISRVLFLGIPGHALTPTERTELNELVGRHFPKGKS